MDSAGAPSSAARGQHDHRHLAALAELTEDLDAAEAREHEVEEDEVGIAADRPHEAELAVGGVLDLDAVLAQVLGRPLGQLGVVFDQEHAHPDEDATAAILSGSRC